MVAYTNESLQNINKKDMIPVILSLLNKLDEGKTMLEEIRKLNNNFSKSIIFYRVDL